MTEYVVICPECGKPGEWAENKVKYGHNIGRSYMCYWCPSCRTFVGCHNNTRKPLGTMANQETLNWRRKAHHLFDRMWNPKLQPPNAVRNRKNRYSRGKAYKWLANEFGLDEIHIGESDSVRCKEIIFVTAFKLLFMKIINIDEYTGLMVLVHSD